MNTDKLRPYRCGFIEVVAPANSCLFCEHCTDVYYDSGGIYMILCDTDRDVSNGALGLCQWFEKEPDA